MATYDAIPRVAEVAGAEIYAKALLLVDEYHRLLFDSYSFRHRAVMGFTCRNAAKFEPCDLYVRDTHRAGITCWMNCRHLPTTAELSDPSEPPMQVRLVA